MRRNIWTLQRIFSKQTHSLFVTPPTNLRKFDSETWKEVDDMKNIWNWEKQKKYHENCNHESWGRLSTLRSFMEVVKVKDGHNGSRTNLHLSKIDLITVILALFRFLSSVPWKLEIKRQGGDETISFHSNFAVNVFWLRVLLSQYSPYFCPTVRSLN